MGEAEAAGKHQSPGGDVLTAAAANKETGSIFRFRNFQQKREQLFSIAPAHIGWAKGNPRILNDTRSDAAKPGKSDGLPGFLLVDQPGGIILLVFEGSFHPLLGGGFGGGDGPEHMPGGFLMAPYIAQHGRPVRKCRVLQE